MISGVFFGDDGPGDRFAADQRRGRMFPDRPQAASGERAWVSRGGRSVFFVERSRTVAEERTTALDPDLCLAACQR